MFKELLMLKQELLDRINTLLADGCLDELSDLIRLANKEGMLDSCYILSEDVVDGIYAAHRLSIKNEKSFVKAVLGAGFLVKGIISIQENGFKRCLVAY
jgi:hypothetical protein